MFKFDNLNSLTNEEKYKLMLNALKGQLSSESDELANLCNCVAIIYFFVDDINWSGFYIKRESELVLGPFQGRPACNRINIGSGVCGTAVEKKQIQRVKDVEQFQGHIACDSKSRSEIVIPIIKNKKIYGVLDIDSPVVNRFTILEEEFLSKAVDILNDYITWENI